MLLFGRAFQDIACAGNLVLVRVILADKVSLEENSRNTSIYTMVAGSAYGIRPVVGGYLT
jgi:MFS family permease